MLVRVGGGRVGGLHGFDLNTSFSYFGRYDFRTLNLPVVRTKLASKGYTFVVFSRSGNEYEFTLTFSSLIAV